MLFYANCTSMGMAARKISELHGLDELLTLAEDTDECVVDCDDLTT